MQTIKLTKAIPSDGLAEGDLLTVDEFSAAALIKRGDAVEYKPETTAGTAEVEETTYGGQEGVRTIDDIVDPQVARNKRVMTATVVGAVDDGSVRRAPDSNPAGSPDVADADNPDLPSSGDAPTADTTSTTTTTGSKKSKSGSSSTSTEQAASGAQPAGGDAGGGSTS